MVKSQDRMKYLRVTIIRDKTDLSPKLEMCFCSNTVERYGLISQQRTAEDFTIVAVSLNH